MIGLLLILAAAPGVALLVFFYLKDKHEPEPHGHVVTAFLYGFLVLTPALFTGEWLSGLVGQDFLVLGGFRAEVYSAFVLAAWPEEGFKFLLFMVTIARWREFDEPFDGIVYGVALSLGLGTVENIAYVLRVYGEGGASVELALLRAVLAVPAHALYGALMGYYVGRAKFMSNLRRRILYFAAAPLSAFFFHGLYDLLCAYVGPFWGWGLVIAVSLMMWAGVLWMMPQALKRSPFIGWGVQESSSSEAVSESPKTQDVVEGGALSREKTDKGAR